MPASRTLHGVLKSGSRRPARCSGAYRLPDQRTCGCRTGAWPWRQGQAAHRSSSQDGTLSFIGFFGQVQAAAALVGAQNKAGRGGEHVVQRRKALGHEDGDFLEAAALDDDLQIINCRSSAARCRPHQTEQSSCRCRQSRGPMGGHAQLNDSLNEVDTGLFPVHERLIAADIAFAAASSIMAAISSGVFIQHRRDVLNRHTGVLFQNAKQFFHSRYTSLKYI